ncbi:MAG: hypothetical protein ACI4YA_05125 [Candidatus Spyradenecus sp.]
MKATLAMIACLAMAGFLTAAATVEGNNTAVVIQKDKVESKTGWQLLCVPVEGLAINGSSSGAVAISTILPPDSYDVGTSVWINSDQAFTLEEKDGNRAWTRGGSQTTDDLTPGQIFWIKKPAADVGTGDPSSASGLTQSSAAVLTAEAEATSDPITFCGQNHARSTITRPSGGSTALCANDSSEALKISAIAPEGVKKGDQIFRIQNGKSNYQIYRRLTSGWKLGNDDVTDEDVIAPGESFYYYSAN